MAPGTGGRGAPLPPKDGVYRPSPSMIQAHFPSRGKMVRAYGTTPRRRQEAVALKQQTLTQIDFVSSFSEDEDPIVLSDSDEEGWDEGRGKSKETDLDGQPCHGDDDSNDAMDDASPRAAKQRIKLNTEVRRKRHATVDGDEQTAKRKPGFARHKNFSSSATPTPSHHTQTLTQFLGRGSHVAAVLDGEDDQAFLEWLGEPCSPRRAHRNVGRSIESKSCQTTDDPTSEREGSVVPQTPVKSRKGRTGSTSPGDISTASTTRSRRHDQQQSSATESLKDPIDKLAGQGEKTASLVIQDSFVTSSWNSETPTKRSHWQLGLNESQNASLLVLNTSPLKEKSIASPPTPSRPADEMPNRGLKGKQKVGFDEEHLVSFVGQRNSGDGTSTNPEEIPDSEDDDDDGLSGDGIHELQDDDEAAYIAGAETQLVLEELSFIARQQQLEGESNADSKTPTPSTPALSSGAKLARPIHKTKSPPQDKHVQSPLGLDQARLIEKPRGRPLRRPLPPLPVYDQSQFAESQRVPIQILQGLPPASALSDIVLPIESETLRSLIGGYQVELCISYKIPNQVVRLWLFDGSHLRYMACVQHGRPRGSQWAYAVDQMYELNNPVADGDMREEGWVNGPIRRYVYLPPAVVGQLLWNLKHAIFADDYECEDSARDPPVGLETSSIRDCTLSQNVPATNTRTAQPVSLLRTRDNEDLLSTQGSETNTTPSISNATPRPFTTTTTTTTIQPLTSSPGKTDSQRPPQQSASLPKPHPLPSSPLYSNNTQDHSPPLPSSSLVFQDHGASAVSPLARDVQISVSQLLTKSQMLPDSLLQDGPGLPREIWDSDDDVDF